jgi:site-specific DNA-cytosine methylase
VTQPSALGVYIFAGGFTLGIRKHFKVTTHFEDGPFGVATSKHNGIIDEAFTDPASWPKEQWRGVPLIYGNPPCAPWSAAGHLPNQKNRLAAHGAAQKYELDPRVECVRKQFSLLEELEPTIWVWESVARAYSTGRPFVDQLTARAIAKGYAVTHVLVNGLYCGAPQQRRRFFFVAHKVELPFSHPGKAPQTVGDVLTPELYKEHPWVGEEHPFSKAKMTGTVAQFVNGMEPGEGGHERFYRWKKDRNEEVTLNDKGRVTGRPNFLMHRLAYDKVCGTIVSGTCLIHPEYDRFLTVAETQLLSGYPLEYVFEGRDAYAQISKAVLPPVADWLGGVFRSGIDNNIPVFGTTVRTVNYMKPTEVAA